MPILKCIATEEGSQIAVGEKVIATFVREDEGRDRKVYDLIKPNGEHAGRVYWYDSGEIKRCCFTKVKFREVK